jgi:hypothetical protein
MFGKGGDEMNCLNCGTDDAEGSYCYNCGAELKVQPTCPKCAAPFDGGKFCTNCGNSLALVSTSTTAVASQQPATTAPQKVVIKMVKCRSCGSLNPLQRYCKICAAELPVTSSPQGSPRPPSAQVVKAAGPSSEALAGPAKPPARQVLVCLACGYKGSMPVFRRHSNLAARRLAWILGALVSAFICFWFVPGVLPSLTTGIIVGTLFALLVSGAWPIKTFARCPNCTSELGPLD